MKLFDMFLATILRLDGFNIELKIYSANNVTIVNIYCHQFRGYINMLQSTPMIKNHSGQKSGIELNSKNRRKLGELCRQE